MNEIIEIAKKIKLAIFDVDGIFTDGSLVYDANGLEYKSFHVHDGQGIKLIQKSGIEVAVITSRKSDMVAKRMQELGVTHVYQGFDDKLLAYAEVKNLLNIEDSHIAYMGDDLHDLPLLKRAALKITVPNAPEIIKKNSTFITELKGGHGAVREFCEWLLRAQNNYDAVIQSYLDR